MIPSTHRSARGFLVLMLLVGLSHTGCKTVAKTKNFFGGTFPLEVEVVEGANSDSPVAVDLIIVHDKKLTDKLLGIPTVEWFAGTREQFHLDYPDGYQSWSWEWVPGYSTEVQVPIKSGAKTAILFADYFSDAPNRMQIDPRQPSRLVLGLEAFTVEPLP